MRLWQLLLRNANVLQSVLERAEPELSSFELDARRLFILSTVEAHPFPADIARALSLPKPSITFLVNEARRKRLLTATGRKRVNLRRYNGLRSRLPV